jgi:hypothetical protein
VRLVQRRSAVVEDRLALIDDEHGIGLAHIEVDDVQATVFMGGKARVANAGWLDTRR